MFCYHISCYCIINVELKFSRVLWRPSYLSLYTSVSCLVIVILTAYNAAVPHCCSTSCNCSTSRVCVNKLQVSFHRLFTTLVYSGCSVCARRQMSLRAERTSGHGSISRWLHIDLATLLYHYIFICHISEMCFATQDARRSVTL